MKHFASSRREDLVAVVILLVGVSLFHARGILPGQTFLPVDLADNNLPWVSEWHPLQNWLISDPLYEYYPFLVNAVDSLQRTHHWPLWNPRIFLGHPLLADPIAQTFYPAFTLLGLLMGAARGIAVGLWLHVLLAALLTYGLLRTLGCHPPASILGAFTYALSGALVTWFETLPWVSTIAWFPGILWAFELAVRKRRLRYSALAALAVMLAILGGDYRSALAFCLIFAVYALGRGIELTRAARRLDLLPLLVALISVGLGTLLSAVQLLPFAEFFSLTRRVISRGLVDPLPWRQLVTLIVPDFYGNPAGIGAFWGDTNYAESTVYTGVVALVLACVAPFRSPRFPVIYLYALAIGGVYFVVGGPGVQLLGGLPVLKYLSLHRSACVLPLIVAMLAAMALGEGRLRPGLVVLTAILLASVAGIAWYQNWYQVQSHWQEVRQPVLVTIALLTVAVALILWQSKQGGAPSRLGDWGLVGLVFVDLYLFGSKFNPAGPIVKLMPPTASIEYLQAHAGTQRVLAYQNSNMVFGPNVLMVFGLAEAGGYSSLVSDRYHQLVAAADPVLDIPWMSRESNMVMFSHPPRRLLDLLNVGYVVSELPMRDPGIRAEFVVNGCDSASSEIGGSQVLSGTFQVRDVAINRLDLRFRVDPQASRDIKLVVRLWRGADREHLILESRQDPASMADQQSLTLYFAPEREAPGQTYAWEVVADGPSSRTGVALCLDALGNPALSVYGADWFESYGGEVHIFERLSPLPRAYVAYSVEPIADDAAAVARLLDESFDVRNIVITPESLGFPIKTALPATRANLVRYEDTRVIVEAVAAQRGILVLGDQFHPGWRAYLDGQPTAVLRVNQIMRGVIVPPGSHEIVFEFAPGSLKAGAQLSLLGLVTLVILARVDTFPKVAKWLGQTKSG